MTNPKLFELELKKCCCDSRQDKLIRTRVVPDRFICLFGRHYYGYNKIPKAVKTGMDFGMGVAEFKSYPGPNLLKEKEKRGSEQ